MNTVVTESSEQTRALARDFAESLQAGDVLALHGDLGSGKTCFVQGLAEGLGVEDVVSSPTYLILHEYEGRIPLNHMDLYRLKSPGEVLAFGFEEYLEAAGVLAIEWPEKALDFLNEKAYHIYFELGDDPDRRRIIFKRGRTEC